MVLPFGVALLAVVVLASGNPPSRKQSSLPYHLCFPLSSRKIKVIIDALDMVLADVTEVVIVAREAKGEHEPIKAKVCPCDGKYIFRYLKPATQCIVDVYGCAGTYQVFHTVRTVTTLEAGGSAWI
uniref:18KD n=1 Tax=Taenia pisiformis TaxID=85432 RepID=I1ZIU4_TAEPI|nr:18KD [Taenia pisiformis]